jgi:hypothetical protein
MRCASASTMPDGSCCPWTPMACAAWPDDWSTAESGPSPFASSTPTPIPA